MAQRPFKVYEGGKAATKKTATRKKKRTRNEAIDGNDPRRNVEGRVFEIVSSLAEGEDAHCTRVRVRLLRKGGIGNNLYDFGNTEYLAGMISEMLGPKKWTPYGYGLFPTDCIGFIREVVEPEPVDKKE